jgi:mono/diheme cytochrome c family protein
MKLLQVGIFGISLILVSSCTEQHDPTGHHKMLKAEHEMAQRVVPKLAPDGTLPKNEALAGAGDAVSEIDGKYNTFCVSCHGPNGDGNTPAGQALKPNPRNFTDAAWQEKTTDDRIAQVIKEGGAAVGLSPMMAAWGALLSDAQIKEMVGKVRGFKKK